MSLNPDKASQKVIDELAGYFEDASKRLKKQVLDVGASDFTRGQAAGRYGQVRSIIDDLKGRATRKVGGILGKAVDKGVADADAQAAAAGIRDMGGVAQGNFNLIDRRSIEVIARATHADLFKAADAMQNLAFRALNRMADVGLNNADVNKIIAGGLIEGKPREMISLLRKDLQDIHGERVPVPCQDGSTRSFETGYYARLVADSKWKEATRVGRHERLKDVGLDLVKVIGPYSTYPCTHLLGKIFSLSGTHPKYPAFSSVSEGQQPYRLFHPHCHKTTVPFVEGLSIHNAEGGAAAPAVAA